MRISPAHFTLILVCLLLASLAVHTSAVVVPRQITVNPQGESLLEGTAVNVSAEIEIIPSGATTFSETHTLSLSTDLLDARWQVVVVVDGLQAAVIPKEGNHVFVNGYLLSYPTTRDVSVRIMLEGGAPPVTDNQELMVLRFAELNSQGKVVSESEHSVTRAVPGKETPYYPAPTTSLPSPATTPEKVALSCVPVLGAVLMVFSWTRLRGMQQNTITLRKRW